METPPADPSRARLWLVFLALVSASPAFWYYRLVLPDLESTRILGGLMPLHFLTLRLFGGCLRGYSALCSCWIVLDIFSPRRGPSYSPPLRCLCSSFYARLSFLHTDSYLHHAYDPC